MEHHGGDRRAGRRRGRSELKAPGADGATAAGRAEGAVVASAPSRMGVNDRDGLGDAVFQDLEVRLCRSRTGCPRRSRTTTSTRTAVTPSFRVPTALLRLLGARQRERGEQSSAATGLAIFLCFIVDSHALSLSVAGRGPAATARVAPAPRERGLRPVAARAPDDAILPSPEPRARAPVYFSICPPTDCAPLRCVRARRSSLVNSSRCRAASSRRPAR